MAYIKIFGIKSTVKKTMDYITNPDKTADLTFSMTAKLEKDNVMKKGDNLA